MTLESQVERIMTDISRRGDRALFDYTKKFDGHRLTARSVEVPRKERRSAWRRVDPETIRALRIASQRIRRFHERQKVSSWTLKESGLSLGLRWTPLERVGLYVPGGRAAYPSSVLMTAIPAKVAQVGELVMTTPCPLGEVNPAVLVAADLAGVDRIFKVGGAQAIAALAYGTRTIPRVDKIVGPGNRYVAEAKRQVLGKVAIDMIAGPSEVVILADEWANPCWIAADLIAQAEHDPEARPIVISTSRSLLSKVRREVERRVCETPRRKIAGASFQNHGEAIFVRDLNEGLNRINRLAPEHLELHVRNPRRLLPKILHAGAIFVGPWSPVALGDFAAGPNHVLPTAGTARFSSPLGVYDFLKATTVLEANHSALKRLAPVICQLAHAEGLTAHAESVDVRFP